MIRDRLIAISDTVSRDVPIPLALGALRASEDPKTWEDDVLEAFGRNERAILSGHFEDFAFIAKRMGSLGKNFPYARCGLLLHWKQALALDPELDHLFAFNLIHIAIDEALDAVSLKTLKARWEPQWVWIPKTGFPWKGWIAETLVPNKSGVLKVLTPAENQAQFMSADELRVFISEFSVEHPLLHFESVPQEWYAPSELGPWTLRDRASVVPETLHDSRTRNDYPRSAIIPFQWSNNSDDLQRLQESLSSVLFLQTASLPCEIILAVDRMPGAPKLCVGDVFPSHSKPSDFVMLDLVRSSSIDDWKAGAVRNRGAEFCRNQNGHFLFMDSDVAVRDNRALSDVMAPDSFDLIQIAAPNQTGFAQATSSLMVIRASLFRSLGGFAEAFHQYGCEDNFLVWQVEKANGVIGRLERNTFEHLRPRNDRDDVVAKMNRLQSSANLMYRMTLDPKVHRHFYSALGESVWFRAFTKRMYSRRLSRLLLAPLLFFMTLLETESVGKYLAGFYDVVVWKLKHPILWLKSQSWKAQTPWHFVRKNAWRIPHLLLAPLRSGRTAVGTLKVKTEIGWIKFHESRFGWNLVGWRLALAGNRLLSFFRSGFSLARHQGRMFAIRVQSAWDHVKWRPAVWSQRFTGGLKKVWTIYVFVPALYILSRPGHVLKSQVWRLQIWRERAIRFQELLIGFIVWRLQIWRERAIRFQELLIGFIRKITASLQVLVRQAASPTEYFRIKTPHFYKWVWRPIMKTRYFLQYHLIQRWRRS